MVNLLLQKKKQQKNSDKRIVWGIYAPKQLKLAYKLMATSLRVPISVLVTHVLTQWIIKHGQQLNDNKINYQNYGDYLAKKYIT